MSNILRVYIFWRSVLCLIWGWEELHPFSGMPFYLIDWVLWITESSQFQKVPLIYWCSQCLCNWCYILGVVSYAHALKATSHFLLYRVQCGQICIELFNPFGLEFVHGDRYGSTCILFHFDIQLCQHHLLKMLSFFHCIILASLSKIKCSWVCGFISESLFLFHWSNCILLCQYQSVFITVAL